MPDAVRASYKAGREGMCEDCAETYVPIKLISDEKLAEMRHANNLAGLRRWQNTHRRMVTA